ncbi:hypothetical protein AB0M36_17070 [Actinoplanes sp. NPDC051346]|uniref:hypothetical protein n=1 Tax=Actinoplanes sp. NPDC051346 TaxID=3155048 RepID=UPI00341D93F9
MGDRLVTRRSVLLLAAVAAASSCSSSASSTEESTDEYVLAVLIEGNRQEVLQAISDEGGLVVLEVEETGTLRVVFDVPSPDELQAVQRRLRARGITAVVPAQGVPLTPSLAPPQGPLTGAAGHAQPVLEESGADAGMATTGPMEVGWEL